MKRVYLGSLRSQSGQGIVEYILVLIVTLALILGLLWQFSDAFRAWANNYFGEYLACLLETGELPSVGGMGGVAGTCNRYFEPFSIANGRPPRSSPSSSSDSAGSGDSSNGQGKDGREDTSSGGSDTSYLDGAGSNGSASSGTRFKAAVGASTLSLNSPEGARVAHGEKLYTGSTTTSVPGGLGRNDSGSNRMKIGNLDRVYGFQSESPEQGRTSEKISVSTVSQGQDAQKKSLILQRKTASKDLGDEDEEPWSFGDYFRFLIIAAIIIALVVFLGGQALQIGKSMD